jgi:ankyrin repeat protein
MGRTWLIGWWCVLALVGGTRAGGGDSPLADAAEKRDWARVRALLNQGEDVNQSQVDGMTALHWAVYHDKMEVAESLVTAGSNVQAANRYGVVPLALACTNGSGPLVRLLLDSGADSSATLRGGETALMTAARTGVDEPVDLLLRYGADVHAKDWRGQTALMWAAADGHASVVQRLIEAGADFKTPLPSGFNPLFFAVREGRIEVVKTLLEAGADVNEAMQPKKRLSGKAPRAGTSPLILAVENAHFELAVVLLKAGADPNDDRSGFTALHTVSWVRKPSRGDGDDGDPAPAGSGSMSCLDFVRRLVEHGADVNRRLTKGVSGRGILSRVGATPFLMSSITADTALMRTLVELGADPLTPNAEGCTPLLAAAGVGTLAPGEEAGTEPEVLEALALLLEWGCDVNAVDANGETAVHGAAYKSLPQVIQFLVDRGANIEVWNRKNKYGWTPLSIAEGYRVGNFKPSAETIAALHKVMTRASSP